jgi:hypothetical protein
MHFRKAYAHRTSGLSTIIFVLLEVKICVRKMSHMTQHPSVLRDTTGWFIQIYIRVKPATVLTQQYKNLPLCSTVLARIQEPFICLVELSLITCLHKEINKLN